MTTAARAALVCAVAIGTTVATIKATGAAAPWLDTSIFPGMLVPILAAAAGALVASTALVLIEGDPDAKTQVFSRGHLCAQALNLGLGLLCMYLAGAIIAGPVTTAVGASFAITALVILGLCIAVAAAGLLVAPIGLALQELEEADGPAEGGRVARGRQVGVNGAKR